MSKNRFLICPCGTLLTAATCALLVVLFSTAFVKNIHASKLERQTTEGLVIGVEHDKTQTISWKAIPYAKPPVGELRWKASAKPEKRDQPLKADTFCQVCPQYVNHDRNPATPQIIYGREDCLYLNIWAPANANSKTKLPVFFWIHGGGNSIQWPLLSMQSGAPLAHRGNMVVITLNYRLGPMGFLNHPALKTGNKENDSGNFALLDQITALKWVQDNIENFGGDPENVTIAGESAGGLNVFCLVASPLAKGLFHRAISQSGGIRPSTPKMGADHINGVLVKLMVNDGTVTDETTAIKKLAAMSSKDIEKYMRSKKASDFLQTYPGGPVRGMIKFPTTFGDGHVLPTDFYGALTSGNYNKVPMILGTNKEETKLFTRTAQPFASWRNDFSLFQDPAKMNFYDKVTGYQSDVWKAMGVDGPARIMMDNNGQPQVFAYQFLWGAGGAKGKVMAPPLNILLGSCHALEIDFVFGTDNASLGALVFSEKNKPGRVALSHAMMDYWAQFARTGNPNKKDSKLPLWSGWTNAKGPKTLLLDADLETARITMSDIEVTRQTIEASLKTEKLQQKIQPFLNKSIYRFK